MSHPIWIDPLKPSAEDGIPFPTGFHPPLGMASDDTELAVRMDLCRHAEPFGMRVIVQCRERGGLLRPILWDGHPSRILLLDDDDARNAVNPTLRDLLTDRLPERTGKPLAHPEQRARAIGWENIRAAVEDAEILMQTNSGAKARSARI